MQLQIEQNGRRREITSTELFQLAASGAIFPKTRLWVDGKETTCDNVQGIVFGSRSIAPQASNVGSERAPSGSNDPRVIRTPYLDYYIGGGTTPYVICYLDAGRSVYSSAGGRVWMKGNVETSNNTQGGFFKALGRLASGETFFMSTYAARSDSQVAFATKLPGAIVARQLAAGESVVCQRGAFLAASPGVSLELFFQKKLTTGFFGGEGFFMQKLTGPGVVFLEIDGAPVEYDLQPGERVTCDTGALAWMDATCSVDVVFVKGIKNMLFGGEGVFDTVVTGPGRATFQSLSAAQTAGLLAPFVAKLLPAH